MTEQRQILKMRLEILGDKNNDSKDDIFKSRLEDAESIALDIIYPYDNTKEALPYSRRLRLWQVRCAIELYKAMEHFGVQSYAENGLSISYLSSLVSTDLKNELVPKAGVPR